MDHLFTGEGSSNSGTCGTSFKGKIASDELDGGLVTWYTQHRYVRFTHFPDPSPASTEAAVATKLDPTNGLQKRVVAVRWVRTPTPFSSITHAFPETTDLRAMPSGRIPPQHFQSAD